MNFSFILPQRIFFGEGTVNKTGEEARKLSTKTALIVTSQGMLKRAVLQQVADSLREHELNSTVFPGVSPEPPLDDVDKCTAFARETKTGLIIGLGGGSVMDVAKKAALDLKLPRIMIPTTAGTGSEVTHESVLKVNGEKKAFVIEAMVPDVAIVDPDLMSTMSARLTASSGIDALAHAIECYDSRRSNPMVKALAWQAYLYIKDNLTAAVNNQMAGRIKMALGSLLAGVALGNSGTGLCHAMSYPLSNDGIPHGDAIAMVLPAVLEFNNFDAEVIRQVRNIISGLKMEAKYRSDIPRMAEVVMKDTRHLSNNPREVTYNDVVSIYLKAQGKKA